MKMMAHATGVLALLLAMTYHCCGDKILAIYTPPSQSHMNLKSSLLRELAARGHHITAITPFPEKTPVPNYDEIITSELIEEFKKIGGGNPFNMKEDHILSMAFSSFNISRTMCRTVLSVPQVQKLISSKDTSFDLIILEAFFSDCFLPFGHKFKAPIVKFCSFGGAVWMFDWIANPNPFSYVPDVFLDYSDKMTLPERIWNTIIGTYFRAIRTFHHFPRLHEIVKEFFNETEDLPSLWELDQKTTSLLLLNSHFSIGHPRPLMPNVIEVGGLHVKPPKKLPQDIEKFLNESPHGVIFFSMGSILQSSQLPETKLKALLEAFSGLKEKVLWKWEAESLPGQPSNVKLGKWLPQSDILAHPSIRAFITHGGLLSSQEAIDRGVPVVGIPIFGDQRLNIARATGIGYGIHLDFNNITKDSVTWALREILDNPVYRENAKRISRIYHDQPLKPLDQAVYWTEYVIRHKGAPHMRSAALDLTWYQYFLIDVIAVLVLVVGFIIFLSFFIVTGIYRRLRNITSQNVASDDRKHK